MGSAITESVTLNDSHAVWLMVQLQEVDFALDAVKPQHLSCDMPLLWNAVFMNLARNGASHVR